MKIHNTVEGYIVSLPKKSQRIIKNALYDLGKNPVPGSSGDKERLALRGGREIYRLHIAHTFTAFYSIDKGNKIVRVHEILPIEQAHKKYGRL